MTTTTKAIPFPAGVELIDPALPNKIHGGVTADDGTMFFRRDDRSENGPDSTGG